MSFYGRRNVRSMGVDDGQSIQLHKWETVKRRSAALLSHGHPLPTVNCHLVQLYVDTHLTYDP